MSGAPVFTVTPSFWRSQRVVLTTYADRAISREQPLTCPRVRNLESPAPAYHLVSGSPVVVIAWPSPHTPFRKSPSVPLTNPSLLPSFPSFPGERASDSSRLTPVLLTISHSARLSPLSLLSGRPFLLFPFFLSFPAWCCLLNCYERTVEPTARFLVRAWAR